MSVSRETPRKVAEFSEDRAYRYTLWRDWIGGEGYVQFVGLNPSTADELNDDPTIRRCINFAKDWGFAGFCMTNLFAYRATDPAVMKFQLKPIGADNDRWIQDVARGAGLVVAAWGVHGEHHARDIAVRMLVPGMKCLGRTKNGHPRHPLYVASGTRLVDYN